MKIENPLNEGGVAVADVAAETKNPNSKAIDELSKFEIVEIEEGPVVVAQGCLSCS